MTPGLPVFHWEYVQLAACGIIGYTTLATLTPSLLRTVLVSLLTLEAIFLVYSWSRYAHLNKPAVTRPDMARVKVSMQRFLSLEAVFELVGYQQFLSGWFLGAKWDSIPRGNVEELVRYGFFFQEQHEMEPSDAQLVTDFVEEVEKTWGVEIAPGYDSNLTYMAHLKEPLRVVHKPLIWYLVTETIAKTAHALLWLMGFRRKKYGVFSCWQRLPDTSCTTTTTNSEHQAQPSLAPTQQQDKQHHKPKNTATTTTTSPRVSVQRLHHAADVVHAAEHAVLDAAVQATSTVSAAIAAQHPHEGQAYHLPHKDADLPTVEINTDRPYSPTASHLEQQKQQQADVLIGNNTTGDNSNGKSIGTTKINTPPAAAAAGTTTEQVPLVFLHGVGFGCLPYLHFINRLIQQNPFQPVIVFEIPHVALRLCKEAVSVDDVAAAAVASVKAMGYEKACFIGHSYGSFCVSRIVQLFPEAVHSMALLDPVCLLVCYPQLLYNFIYRGVSASTSIVDLARFACSRDLTIAQAFCRKFHWTDLMLWPEDVPERTLIVLSGKDDLVPSELVQKQFELHAKSGASGGGGGGAHILYHAELGHGGFLLEKPWLDKIVKEIGRLVNA